MNLNNYELVLASGSPRRQQFLKDLEINHIIDVRSVEEVYPKHLKAQEITDYLAKLKAEAFVNDIEEKQIVLTSDTIVWHSNTALGKPKNKNEAIEMIQRLCNDWHSVITSVCFTTKSKQLIKNYTTKVHFKNLSNEEIEHYVNTYNPVDKAGAYGIQEWIGLIGIDKIEGSYFNVVGLPTHIVYETLKALI